MEFQEAMERARAAAYEPSAAVDWDLIEVAGREWADQMEAGPLGEYLGHHLPRWRYPVRIEGAHPWVTLEGRILAQAELPIPTAERNDADSIRSACAAWKSMLGTLDTQDDEARWRGWLCAWVLGFGSLDELAEMCLDTVRHKAPSAKLWDRVVKFEDQWIISVDYENRAWGCWGAIFLGDLRGPLNNSGSDNNGGHQPMTPKMVAQAAQQCFIRVPDRIVARFDLRRWQTSLGFEV